MFACDSWPDYLDERDLDALGIDPGLVRIFCPHALELTGHDGARCWATADLTSLLEGPSRD